MDEPKKVLASFIKRSGRKKFCDIIVVVVLTMKKMVVNTNIVVVISLELTTTYHVVVIEITTGNYTWSLYF